MSPKHAPDHLQVWIARKKFHLSHAQVQMTRELGFNPKKLGNIANHKQEPWKLALPQFIEHLYRRRFGREYPAVVTSIEEKAEIELSKKKAKRARKETPGERIGETCEDLNLRNQEVNR